MEQASTITTKEKTQYYVRLERVQVFNLTIEATDEDDAAELAFMADTDELEPDDIFYDVDSIEEVKARDDDHN